MRQFGAMDLESEWRSRWRTMCCAIVLLLLSSPSVTRGESPAPDKSSATRQAAPRAGLIVVWGGGEAPQGVWERFVEAARAGTSAIVADEVAERHLAPRLEELHRHKIHTTVIRPNTAQLAEKLATRGAVWLDVSALPPDAAPLEPLLISADFLERAPPDALIHALVKAPGRVGLGVPAGAGVVFLGREMHVVGSHPVVVCLPASVTAAVARPLLVKHLKSGSSADLLALSRAAIARLGERFPPEKPAAPRVTSGTLLACGGGTLSDEIWPRFIDLAGGVHAPLVVLPIANPGDLAPKLVDKLKGLGCTDITVLSQRTKQEIESAEFINALKRAKGVFFGGGRQWRYVDAYEGTIAEQLFHDVLARGGVIAGSSAGTAIQGQYMVRGNPLGNADIMAEGYERGLGFLPGAAIDIHVAERERLKEMVDLVETFPQILGLSLDEGCAAEIHGSTMVVLGKGKTHVVTSPDAAPLPLVAGDRYDLVARKKLSP
jgi:cyanophycinase